MSSLWTPSGEHPIEPPRRAGSTTPGSADQESGSPAADSAPGLDNLPPEEPAQAEQLMRQLDEARQQLLATPAASVLAQHCVQLYELAMLHLAEAAPKLEEARLVIDAFAAVLDTAGNRLAEAERPLRDALDNARLSFVEAAQRSS